MNGAGIFWFDFLVVLRCSRVDDVGDLLESFGNRQETLARPPHSVVALLRLKPET